MSQGADVESVDVLIADGDRQLRQCLRLVLEKEGYRCAEAGDGATAVELAQRRPPRCAILDLALPVLDGLAVARALRRDPRTRDVAITCLTGQSDPSLPAQAASAGIETCLTKPMDAFRLFQIVSDQLRTQDRLQASGLSLEEARDQLDRWEGSGYVKLAVGHEDGKGFTVCCVRPPVRRK
jgi:two-component system phosphate regulon response regulator PhoB